MKKALFVALAAAVLAGTAQVALAASESDYQARYAKASALADKALAMDAGWTVTGQALKQSKKAAAGGDYDKATALAAHAEALAQVSIRQSVEQRTAWHAAVVK